MRKRLTLLDPGRSREKDQIEPRQARCRDGTVTIDCRGCPGPQDLREQECMRCLMAALQGTPLTGTLVLSRDLDVAYEGACVDLVRELVEAVALCRGPLPFSPDRSCSGCPSRPGLVLGALADAIPHAWRGPPPPTSPRQHRALCQACAAHVNETVSAVAARLRAIEREASREAFMVVEGPGHD